MILRFIVYLFLLVINSLFRKPYRRILACNLVQKNHLEDGHNDLKTFGYWN